MQTPELEKVRRIPGKPRIPSNALPETQWLSWLHKMLPDVEQLLLFHVKPAQSVELCAQNPIDAQATEGISRAVLSCVHRERANYIDTLPDTEQAVLNIPFRSESSGRSFVLVMVTPNFSGVQQNTAVQLTQWAAAQLRDSVGKHAFTAQQSDTTDAAPDTAHVESQHAIQPNSPDAQLSQALVGAQQRHGTFTGIAFTLVNTLASLCGCVRVSLGCHDGSGLRLVAMSGQSKLDDRRKIARQLCALMVDTLQSQRSLHPNNDTRAAPAVQAYYKSQGEHPLLSFVMPGSRRDSYVLVMERADNNAFVPAQADAIEQTVLGAASLLELVRTQEMPLRKKFWRYLQSQASRMRYVSSWSTKRWFAVIGASVLLLSFFIPVTHRVSADAFIEASDRQVLVAAQNGFILSSHARAGEEVKKGDLLAKIDGQDLQLALEKWQSEKVKNQQEYAQALAIHDRSELSRLRADEKRIDAEMSLLEQQLHRSEVRAPFDGVLLDGDWTQSLGAPISTGDVLFEIASAEQYRLVLEVDEHDIGYIQPQQMAELRMAALPTSVWQAELGDVMPVAVAEKGSSAFRVPANIDGEANALRPGMEGVGKVVIGNRSMFWVYTHSLVDKLSYLGWKLGLL